MQQFTSQTSLYLYPTQHQLAGLRLNCLSPSLIATGKMNPYTEHIGNHELFRLFDKLKGLDDISEAEIAQMKGLVLDIAEHVGPKMDSIKLTFKQYTDHSITHLTNIATLIFKFLPQPERRKQQGLNALELTMLWTGILLHDVGMFVSEREKEEILKGEEFRRFRLQCKDRMEAAVQALRDGNRVRAQAIEDAIIAEYFRRIHAQRSNSYILENFRGALVFRDVEYADEAANLAESHSWQVFSSRNGIFQEKAVSSLDKEHLVSDVPVNLQYLACCLRMADILDFDSSRAPLVLFEQLDFTEVISELEWNKHLSIKGWSVKPEKLQFVAKCKKPAYFVAVQQFLGWVDAELDNFHRIVEGFSDNEKRRYPVLLPRQVNRDKIQMENAKHIPGAFMFQLEFGEIMKLLMDRSLYPDPALFIRELLQNSLDACRYQLALARKAEMDDKYIPRIDVWDYSDDETAPYVVFQDNGVGMSFEIIQNYFLRVGKSYYRSTQFILERESLGEKGIYLDSCSRFGIGFISCFLAGDKVEVETNQMGHDPLKITLEGSSRYFLIEKFDRKSSLIPFLSPEDRASDGPPNFPGTRVTIYLKRNWRQFISSSSNGFVLDTLRNYAVVPDFEIKVYHRGIESFIRGDENFKTVPSINNTFLKSKPDQFGIKTTKKLAYILPAIAAIPITLPESDHELFFRGGIWAILFENGTEFGSPQKGWIRTSGRFADFEVPEVYVIGGKDVPWWYFSALQDTLSPFKGDSDRDLYLRLEQPCIDLLEKLGSRLTPEEFTRFANLLMQEGNLNGEKLVSLMHVSMEMENSNKFCYDFAQGDIEEAWDNLSMDDRVIALRAMQHRKHLSDFENAECIPVSPSYLEAIYNKDLDAMLDHFGEAPLNSWSAPVLRTPEYQLSVHGIRVPGGILDWKPALGKAEKYHFLPRGVFANIDLAGLAVPETAANRLFIIPENAEKVILKVGIAVLRWAYETYLAHNKDMAWKTLFHEFLKFYLELEPKVVASIPNLLKNEIGFLFLDQGYRSSFRITEILEKYGRKIPLAMRSVHTNKNEHPGFIDHPIFKEAPLETSSDGREYRNLEPWLQKYLPDFV